MRDRYSELEIKAALNQLKRKKVRPIKSTPLSDREALRKAGVAEKKISEMYPPDGVAQTVNTMLKSFAAGAVMQFRSKLENDYALTLEARKRKGYISEWRYEPVTYHCGSCKYTPDFEYDAPDGVCCVEVKGSWRGKGQVAAKLRFKAFLEKHAWRYARIYVAQKQRGDWLETVVRQRGL